MELLTRWLLDEKLIRLKKKGFILTPKGHFLSKFLNQSGGEYYDEEFQKILEGFDWSFLRKGKGKLEQ